MINDLLFNWLDCWKYVDDSTVTKTIPRNSGNNLQEILDEIHDWTIRNKIKLNASKSKELIFDFSKEK